MEIKALIPHFDLSRQHQQLAPALEQAFGRVVGNSWFILGEEVKAFEKLFGEYLGVSHCIGCGNGTDALELALAGLGVEVGDEVIVPANTWVSVAEAVVRLGGLPVFADSLPGEYTVDPASVERCISGGTKAVIVVHQYGQPARLDAIVELCKRRKLALIEDCAHAHGTEYNGRKVGSFGDAACFSFYPTKNLGCLGDGGAVATSWSDLAETIRRMANHGQTKRDVHLLRGRNSRLDEMQAAFLRLKLGHLDLWNIRRRAIASNYSSGLDKSMYRLPPNGDPHYAVFHQYVIQTDERERLIQHLEQSGIGVAIHYPRLICDMAPYTQFRKDPEGLVVGTQEKSMVLSLPIFPELTDEEVLKVIHALNTFRG